MLRVRTAPAAVAGLATTVVATAGLLMTPGAAADGPPDPGRCATIQQDLDAYRRGEVQYFVDPEPAWRAAAEQNDCHVRGL